MISENKRYGLEKIPRQNLLPDAGGGMVCKTHGELKSHFLYIKDLVSIEDIIIGALYIKRLHKSWVLVHAVRTTVDKCVIGKKG